jgi:GxxExxY protein
MKKLNKLTEQVIGLAIKVHKELGPGFVEKIYQRALYLELNNTGIRLEREKKVPIYYNKAKLGYQKVDFIVENKVILELKTVSEIQKLHQAQLLSYLKTSKCQVGLILNFAKPKLEIKRMIATTEPRKEYRNAENKSSANSADSASQRLQGKYSMSAAKVNKKTATTESQKEYRNAENT